VTRLLLLAPLLVLLSACGYHVGGKADLLPQTIHTVYIPAFGNITQRYTLTDRLPEAISREFIARTRYRPVPKEDEADAILRGAVTNYYAYPIISDPNTGRATSLQMGVTMQISLVERTTGKVLYNRPGLDIRQRYEIAPVTNNPNLNVQLPKPNTYFDESEAGLERLSREAARTVVSAILEAF